MIQGSHLCQTSSIWFSRSTPCSPLCCLLGQLTGIPVSFGLCLVNLSPYRRSNAGKEWGSDPSLQDSTWTPQEIKNNLFKQICSDKLKLYFDLQIKSWRRIFKIISKASVSIWFSFHYFLLLTIREKAATVPFSSP